MHYTDNQIHITHGLHDLYVLYGSNTIHQPPRSEGEKAYLDRSGGVLNVNRSNQWCGKGTKNNEEDTRTMKKTKPKAHSRRQTEKSKAPGEEKKATLQPPCPENEQY